MKIVRVLTGPNAADRMKKTSKTSDSTVRFLSASVTLKISDQNVSLKERELEEIWPIELYRRMEASSTINLARKEVPSLK